MLFYFECYNKTIRAVLYFRVYKTDFFCFRGG